MKNPCLHPGSYRLFDAVYYQELDDMFDGEVLVFSASKQCKTAQVFNLCGCVVVFALFFFVTGPQHRQKKNTKKLKK